jgi:deoxyribonuclease-4
MKKIGLHLRLTSTVIELAQKALALELPFFQCFFINQSTNQFMRMNDEQIKEFVIFRREHFKELYVHGSYWINLANPMYSLRVFMREYQLAQQLEFTHMILHPGASGGSKQNGIKALAHALNTILTHDSSVTLVLENVAHAGRVIGGDLQDFVQLRQLLKYPEKIKFCLDTAHAYAYGYDITAVNGRNSFIQQLERSMGLDSLMLIHFNDTSEALGKKIDRHSIPGQGKIGKENLIELVNSPQLQAIPLLMELPVLTDQDEQKMYNSIKKWFDSE